MSAPGILLVGCGNMGRALLRGWLHSGWSAEEIQAVEPEETARGAARAMGVTAAAHRPPGSRPGVVVLAVKPQQLDTVLPGYRDLGGGGCLFLSIAAGKPLAVYEQALGTGTPVVRAMPNTPAAIGRGMTALVGNGAADRSRRDTAEALLRAVGEVAWLEAESAMDAVTAVSGSGPAYVFLLIECLAEAGAEMGLPPELAQRLAVATVAGAGVYAAEAEVDPAELRRRVTSPGGTTEAALEVLAGDGALRELIVRAVRAAAERSRELA